MAHSDFPNSILVTGGAGYIGGQTVLSLLDLGADVVVLDDLSTGKFCDFHEQTSFYEGKIHDQGLVKRIIEKHAVKSIMHFAGSIKVDESISNPLQYYYNNTEGSRLLVDAAVNSGVEQFIFSSTAAVYGTVEQGKLVEESDATNPLNPYGWSKLLTEKLLMDVERAHGLQYGVLRYFNVAGADTKGRHGQYLKNPVHLIGRGLDAMLGNGPELSIFGNTLSTKDGTGVRDYIHVMDLAQAHIDLLQYLNNSKCSALFNLGYGVGSSVLDVIKSIERVSGNKVPYIYADARDGEAAEVVASPKKMLNKVNWKPKHNGLDEIVSSSLSWLKKNV